MTLVQFNPSGCDPSDKCDLKRFTSKTLPEDTLASTRLASGAAYPKLKLSFVSKSMQVYVR